MAEPTYASILLQWVKICRLSHFRPDGDLYSTSRRLKRYIEEVEALLTALGVTNET